MWKIKDPELKLKVNQLVVSDDRIATCCREQMKDPTDYISLESEVFKLSMRVDKDYFEEVPEYNPDGWNPFPALRPPRPGNYLVYLNGRFEHKIRVSYFNTDFRSWDQYSGAAVLAFRELEIEPPADDILKFSAYKRE